MRGFFHSLFWKISLVFLLILLVISGVYIYLAVNTAEMYFQETRQKLDTNIAPHIAAFNKCFIGDSVNNAALKEVFFNAMVINPSIEVYLLDTAGTILTYYAPHQTVQLKAVPLGPIRRFITQGPDAFVMGTDPKRPDKEKAFSAAKVYDGGKFRGYIYVILEGQEYENASQLLFGSYILRLGIRSMVVALVTAALIGFIAIGFIVRNLRRTVEVIRDFQGGNLAARIPQTSTGELQEFARSFNEMADTIVRNIEQIRGMDRQRRDLVANVSHDLRTPLSILRGYVETVLMKDPELSPAARQEYYETILNSTDRLRALVDELFELSVLEAKETAPRKEMFSLAELMQDILQKNRNRADAPGIALALETGGSRALVHADIGMMEKVFQNLLDNAMKFTPGGGKITMTVSDTADQGILAGVHNTGPGIDPEELPHLFTRFYHGNRTSTTESDGTGLGLTIVKRILDLHGFEISVKSEKDKETVFLIRIPRGLQTVSRVGTSDAVPGV